MSFKTRFLNILNKYKTPIRIASATLATIILVLALYLKALPAIISSPKTTNFISSEIKKSINANLTIENPKLFTSFSPFVKVWIKKIKLEKDGKELLNIENLNLSISWAKIFKNTIILDKFAMDYIFADIANLSKLAQPAKKTTKKQYAPNLDWINSLVFVKNFLILTDITPEATAKIYGNGLSIADTQNPKFVRFNIGADVTKDKDTVHFGLADNDTVYIKDKKLHVENGILAINDSKVFINYVADTKNNFDMNVFSDNFELENIVSLLGTNLVIPNGKEMLSFFKDINGNFDFDIKMNNSGIDGNIKLNKGALKLVPLANLPVTANKGKIKITNKEIFLNDFTGFYGNNRNNAVALEGVIKDYTKSVDTQITITGKATNDLTKDYLSKLVGIPVTLTHESGMRLLVNSIYNKIDISWQFKLAKGADILVDGASLSPIDYDRALTADLHFEDNILNIKSINYYIASVLDKTTKGIKPILTLDGNLDMAKNGEIQNLGFKIPKPLPSEFLNVLIGQKMFKGGTIAGDLQFINTGKHPILDGKIELSKVRVPSQRLSLREASLTTDNNSIKLNAFGRFKRSEYKFMGNIKNSLLFPIVIKDVNLTVDNIDVEKLMASMNNQNTTQANSIGLQRSQQAQSDVALADEDDEKADDAFTFDTGILIVERCVLNVIKGFYKEINFGNLFANLTLNKNGILEIKSNKFDFAEGISSLKVFCDLKNHDYRIGLGVKGINSDLIATNLLALKKEISGKANGLIMLNTDKSLKLNGEIKFSVNDGTIGKIGLVEYVMKFASLFRNPLAMISPSAIVDLVNIPEGNFDKISGELSLKNNIIEKIMIKSSASQLSAFIVGKFNLETRDATLRIYTKFSSSHKGFAGFMRNISLNSLANRIPLSSRNDSQYYEAELKHLPPIDADEKDCQVFLTKVDGEVETGNFISSLKKIK